MGEFIATLLFDVERVFSFGFFVDLTYAGRTITAYSTDLNGTTIYGASAGEYVSDNELAENHIKTSATVSDVTANYITNGGFESVDTSTDWPLYWNVTYTDEGNVETTDELLKSDGNKVKINAVVGEVIEISQEVFLKSGEYTLSADFLATSPALCDIYLEIVHCEATYESEFCSFGKVNAAENKSVGSITFTALDYINGGENVTVIIRISPTSSNATIYVDNVTLQKGNGVGKHSYINDGSFEKNLVSTSSTSFWSMYDSSAVAYASLNDGFAQSLKIPGSLYYQKYVSQSIDFNYDDTQESKEQPSFFRLSGFGKALSQMHNSRSTFGLRAEIVYTTNPTSTTTAEISFDKSTENWQFGCVAIPVDSSRTIDYITVYCDYGYNFGTAYFDDIKLVAVEDNTVSETLYDGRGLVSSYRTGLGGMFNLYYTDDTFLDLPLLQVVSGTNKITFYEYDENTKNLLRENIATYIPGIPTEADLTYVSESIYAEIPFDCLEEIYMNDQLFLDYGCNTYTYNAYGLLTRIGSSRTVDYTNISYASTYTYNLDAGSKIFGSVATQIDNNGYVAKYFYDANNGNLLATAGGKTGDSIYDQGYAYTYDAVGRITNVYPASCSTTATSANANTNSATAAYSYNAQSRLSSITTATTTYTFSYDVFGNSDTISAGDCVLVDKDYNTNNGKLQKETYANNFSVNYVYDTLDRVKEIWYNNDVEYDIDAYYKAYTYTYDTNGNIAKLEDHINEQATVFKYDNSGRPVYSTKYDTTYANGNAYVNQYGIKVQYDDHSRVNYAAYSIFYSSSTSSTNDQLLEVEYLYGYDVENRLASSTVTVGDKQYKTDYGYDVFDRLTAKSMNLVIGGQGVPVAGESYTYKLENGNQTAIIDTYNVSVGTNESKYRFEYDSHGNITAIYDNSDNTLRVSYVYDNLNRLTRENNADLGETYVYSYDNGGNIWSKKTYAYTTGTLTGVIPTKTDTYDYGMDTGEPDPEDWNDRLLGYNGVDITYDDMGNPLSYYNGSSYTFTWTQGRRLATAVKGSTNVSYTYNESGIRTSKTVDGTKHTYVLNGTSVYSDTWKEGSVTHVVVYVYGDNGSPIGMMYRNSTMGEGVFEYYIFAKNLQGDIIAVYNSNGTKLVSYKYDAWGNVTRIYSNGGDSTAVRYNSFRYRGYFYDEDTELYYLNSRYYDPAIGRFINADSIGLLGASRDFESFNLYAYCGNNPVLRADVGGEFWHIVGGAVIGGLIGAVSSVVGQVVSGQDINWAEVGISAASGAITGAVTAACPTMGAVATGLLHGVVGAGTYAATEVVNGRTPTVAGTVLAGVTSGVLAGVLTAIFNNCLNGGTTPENAGRPFKMNGRSHDGVDPNTLTLDPNFKPHPDKYKAAYQRIKTSGMYGSVEVTRNGFVLNGQHRVFIARKLGIAVDVIVH